MKLVCRPCDEQMKLEETRGPEEGSLSLVYSCKKCGGGTVLLTNPLETQIVNSLGVDVCPVSQQVASTEPMGLVQKSLASQKADAFVGAAPGGEESFPWDDGAAERLERVPGFIRPMVKKSIVKYAQGQGADRVTEALMDEAKSKMM